ncbi:uncharacterized protein TM35_000082100 [Trypanosoma theileri]|uniref:RNA-editing substrate-binding complex 8 protein HEAT repeats domain-containing protein n=1 Tax=Trypanosoma theileri TaxID=67003 RepID=A0A1X0P0I1_9TRYP|nr:uncharacterized protein TM35_000082100 [Trypanosoma theileri]ORC90412.1 hypothetical protein TM35_000082100 [Trypanosoma theileri]
MRRSVHWMQAGGLVKLIQAVSTSRIELCAEDIYKICALLKSKEDTLMLQRNQAFIRSIHKQYQNIDPDTVTPFQRTFIDGTFAAFPDTVCELSSSSSFSREVGVNGKQMDTTSTETKQQEGDKNNSHIVSLENNITTKKGSNLSTTSADEPSIEERISAIWEVVQEYQSSNFLGTDGMKKIQKHCKALELQLRQIKPFEISSLVRALATIHYQDYSFTNLLTRRSCEVASKLSQTDLCRTYFNLSKLQSHDSMVAFVNQIEIHMEKLHREQIHFVAMALERHPQISSAPARMVPKLLQRAVVHLNESDNATYHRALLVVAARYNLRRHPVVVKIFSDTSRHLDKIVDRDLLAILQSTIDLGISANTPGLPELLEKTESIVPTVDIRHVDALMDILSVLPIDTGSIMTKLMNRLEVDGGKLSIPQLVFILDLLSSYPPAKGNACIVGLAFAASLRAESFDGEALEQVILNLAQLQHFTDDFYTLVIVLQNNKGGFRSFEKLANLMKSCTQEVVADRRGQEMITKGILGLAPSLNDEELAEARKLLTKLGVTDKNVHQMIFRRAKQLQRESGSRWSRRGYDPADDFT